MSSLTQREITFKQIERIFFEIGCEVARTLMQQFLEKVDRELAEIRNKAKLRHKGLKTTNIKTLMGEVILRRAVYKKVNEDGGIEHRYLLDEALGLDTIGNISPNLAEKILEYSCEMSYREVAQAVSNLTNQTISQQEEAERQKVKAFKNNTLLGEKEVPMLFEEADGLWISMQGKDRENSVKGKKEMKVGVVYEGWEKRYPSSKEYKTVEKIAFAGYMSPEEFKLLRDASIAEKYNLDEIRYRIINGDGASWIRQGYDMETEIFQLDQYHLSKNVIRNVSDKKARRHIMRWLKAGDIDKALKNHELKNECGGRKRVKKLETGRLHKSKY